MSEDNGIVDERFAIKKSGDLFHFVKRVDGICFPICDGLSGMVRIYSSRYRKPERRLCQKCMYEAFGITRIDIERGDV